MSRPFLKKGEIFLKEMLSVFLQSGYPAELEAKDLLSANVKTCGYGLTLTAAQALDLAATHRQALNDCGRIEIGTGIVRKIMDTFSRSHYLWQKDYADVLNEAVEAFYGLKNESEDNISDEDLISLLFDAFERYKGSLAAFLQSRELDRLMRALRFGEDYGAEPAEPDGEDEPDE